MALAGVLLLASAGPAAPQAPTFRAGIDLVTFNVTVLDHAGHFVTGLTPADFSVEEDGHPQTIRYFAPGGVSDAAAPLHLGVLLDTSESMRDDIQFARTAAIRFLMALPQARDITLVDFDTKVRMAEYTQSDFPRLVERIRMRPPEGWTALYDAIGVYLNYAAEQTGRKIMLLCTDGGDTNSVATFSDTMTLLKASDVTVYAIGMLAHQSDSTRMQQRIVLQQIASVTGGKAFFPPGVDALDRVYHDILSEIHAQYSLGYVSTDAKLDGTWRHVRIRVVKPGLQHITVRSRGGYYALYMPPKAKTPGRPRF
ncbi:MAG TPA: VWA domain-containing protein [Vicinamibacterales bacterium]|nr:VWA domain-containing protein [Vicinamibacterales bacterium]